MNFQEIGIIGFIVTALLFTIKDYLVAFFRVLFANIFRSGQYNLDGDTSTADWCEMVNDNAEWFMVKILEYHFFYRLVQVRDAAGELHDMRIRTLDFINAPSRELSRQQRVAVSKAGNDWPPLLRAADPVIVDFATRIGRLEVSNKEVQQIILRDLKKIFDEQKDLLALDQKFSEWEKKRPTEMGKLKGRTAKLEDKVSALEDSLTSP